MEVLRRDFHRSFASLSPNPLTSPHTSPHTAHHTSHHTSSAPCYDTSSPRSPRRQTTEQLNVNCRNIYDDDLLNNLANHSSERFKEEQGGGWRRLLDVPPSNTRFDWLNSSRHLLRADVSRDGSDTSTRVALTALDLDDLKTDILAGVRREIVGALKLRSSLGETPTQPVETGPASLQLPPYSNELYMTHLYTQL